MEAAELLTWPADGGAVSRNWGGGFDKVWVSVETVRIELYVCTNWLFGAMLLGSGLRRTKWLLLL
jgi:hypothetical protein